MLPVLASVLLFAATEGVSAQNQPLTQVLKPAFTLRDVFQAFQVPGSKATYPLSINDSNRITGSYVDQSGVVHGFVRDADGNITTFDIPGSVLTEPASINTEGDITGLYEVPNGLVIGNLYPAIVPQGFIRHPDGRVTTFGTASGFPGSATGFWAQPVSINDAGEVVGNSPDGALGSEVFIRSPAGAFQYSSLSAGAIYSTVVTGLNAGGAVVGYTYNGTIGYGFLWDGEGNPPNLVNSDFTNISLPGSVETFPTGINAHGTVVGTYIYTKGGLSRDFVRYTDGTYETLSTPTGTTPGCAIDISVSPIVYNPPPAPVSINNIGTIISCYTDSSSVVSGFLRFEDGSTVTLTHFGSQQTRATAINNSNTITGYYTVGTTVVGFILEASQR
jgi:hypothetical protein